MHIILNDAPAGADDAASPPSVFDLNERPIDLEAVLLSPAVLLKRGMRATASTPLSEDLFTRWPGLREAGQRLAATLTPLWPDPDGGGPLLDASLRRALRAARAAHRSGGEDAEYRAFVYSVVKDLDASLRRTVCCHTGTNIEVYDPLRLTFQDWLRQHEPTGLLWSEGPHGAHGTDQGRLLRAFLVFTLNDLRRVGMVPCPPEPDGEG